MLVKNVKENFVFEVARTKLIINTDIKWRVRLGPHLRRLRLPLTDFNTNDINDCAHHRDMIH